MEKTGPNGQYQDEYFLNKKAFPLFALQCKNWPIAVSSFQDEGEFEGYASVFGAMDLSREVVMPGAFRETLERRGTDGIKLLWQHEPQCILGKWQEICEDRRGLYVRGKLDLEQTKSREVLSLMRKGALDGLSIGYRTEVERKNLETGLRQLERLDLWEISLVTFPLLPAARVSRVKSIRG